METTSNIVIEESKSVDIQSSKSDVMKLLDLDSKFRIEGVKGDLHDSLSLLEESVWTPDLPTIRNSSLFQYDSKDEEEESEDEEEESEDEEEESEKEEESEDEEGENEKKETKNETSNRHVKTLFKYFPILKKLDWKNIALAGGAVTSALTRFRDRTSDLDFFVYGLATEDEAEERADDLISQIIGLSKGNLEDSSVVRTQHCVTINISEDEKYQIILRLYKTVSEIIHGFDLGSCACAFDGKSIVLTSLGKFCIKNRVNIVDTTRRSLSYEYRLSKYFQRGFAIVLPYLDIDKLEPLIEEQKQKHMKNLEKLISKKTNFCEEKSEKEVARDLESLESLYQTSKLSVKVALYNMFFEMKVDLPEVKERIDLEFKRMNLKPSSDGKLLSKLKNKMSGTKKRQQLPKTIEGCVIEVSNVSHEGYSYENLSDYGTEDIYVVKWANVQAVFYAKKQTSETGEEYWATVKDRQFAYVRKDARSLSSLDLLDYDKIKKQVLKWYDRSLEAFFQHSNFNCKLIKIISQITNPIQENLCGMIMSKSGNWKELLIQEVERQKERAVKVIDSVRQHPTKIMSWKCLNPGSQLSGSFNPIIAEPEKWYLSYYTPNIKIFKPDQTNKHQAKKSKI
jgi:hypothetical protein